MKRLTSGMVPLLALLLAAGCTTEPTESLRNGVAKLIAAPSQLFLEVGGTKSVDVSAIDEQGNPLQFDYQVTAVGSGITVKRDSTYLPIYVDDTTLTVPPIGPAFRFTVVGAGYGATSFTVTAGDSSVVVPVQVIPQTSLAATFSNTTPALGETVTLTAPPGTQFAQTSTVSFSGSQSVILSVAADGSSIDFVPPPNVGGQQATVTDVSTSATPDLIYAPLTVERMTTPAVASFSGTYSNVAPAVNEAVTLTLTDATFAPDATLILGAGSPTIANLTATSVTFIPAPGTTALLVINGVVLNTLPQFSLTLPSADTDTIKVAAVIPAVPGTDAAATAPSLVIPAVGFSSLLYDKPDFTVLDLFYKLVVTEAGTYTITMDWDIGDDVDVFLCPEPGAITGACDFSAATGAHPESHGYALVPGTYYVIADDFAAQDGDPTTAPSVGATLTIAVDHAAP